LGRKIPLKLRKLIQLILDKARQMGAHDTGFVGRRTRTVVPDHRVLAQGSTKRDNLLGQILQVLPNQIVTTRVEKNGEAPRILECNQAGFSGVEIDVHDVKVGNALARHLRPINSSPLLRIEDCNANQPNDVADTLSPQFTHMKSTPKTPFCIVPLQSLP
jgi:hypothetical protein